MSFIDDALLNSNTGYDFVNAMADIYSNSDVRDILDNYPEWIRDIICIIDYDTDLQMEGLGKLPRVIEITGWERMTNKLPHDAQMFNKLLDEYNEQYGVIYNNICEIVYK